VPAIITFMQGRKYIGRIVGDRVIVRLHVACFGPRW
jgi:hypothetical protein